MKDKYITIDFILDLIYSTIDNHNKLNPKDLLLEKKLETILLGPNGNLDSLGLLTFLVEVETLIQNNVDKNISVLNENFFMNENGPYKNVDSLSKYILSQIKCL